MLDFIARVYVCGSDIQLYKCKYRFIHFIHQHILYIFNRALLSFHYSVAHYGPPTDNRNKNLMKLEV